MNPIKRKTVPIREKRLNAINAYLGPTAALLQEFQQGEIKQRIRTFSQSVTDDVLTVLRLLSELEDIAVVIHSPRGCSASQLYFDSFHENKNRWAITNLNERDTIMGGDESLRQAIITLYQRYHPKVIFVVTTPVVAINNDDVFSVVEELREEFGVLIIPIYTDGFKSKTGVSGYDAALHALLKYLPLETSIQSNTDYFVNVLSLNENQQDVVEIVRLIHALGLETNLLPGKTVLQNFAKAAQAQTSISLHNDYSEYLGRVLASQYNVPYLEALVPIGIKNTHQWLVALGKSMGRENQAQLVARAHETEWLKEVLVSYQFSQVKVYVNLSANLAWGLVGLVEELGAQVIGITVHHVDQLHQSLLADFNANNPSIPLHVADGQPFEQANILNRLQPDLYIGNAADTVWAAKQGIAALSVDHLPLLGYRGAAFLAHELNKTISNQTFVQNLHKNTSLPYRAQWYGKSPSWHIKMEVK